jgi:hypothetical protein
MANTAFFLFRVTVEPKIAEGLQNLQKNLEHPFSKYTPFRKTIAVVEAQK